MSGPTEATHTEEILEGVEISFDNLGKGTVRYSVRYDGETVHSVNGGADLIGSDQKTRTFANAVRDQFPDSADVDPAAVKRELLGWFAKMNDLTTEEKREHFMSDVARQILDGTGRVTVYEGEHSVWEVQLSLFGSEEWLEFGVDDIRADSADALEKAILNYWHELIEISEDDWKAIREAWLATKTVRQVNEYEADTVADSVLRYIRRSVRPVTDSELLGNDPAAAWYDATNGAAYDQTNEPEEPVLWIQDEFLVDQLEAAGKKPGYKAQLVKDLIKRGELFGKGTRRRWTGQRARFYPFNPERLGIDAEDTDDGDTGAASEVEA